MRLSSSRVTALTHRPQQDFPLWDKAGSRPSLDLQFADRRDLVDATTGSNLVDFTRASSATYVGSDGLIKLATTDEARFDHDPTTGESLGLLVEESRTNLLTDSEDLSVYATKSVTVPFDSSVINPTGSTGSYKILADAGTTGANSARINSSASSSSSVVVSAFVKKSTHRYVFIGFGGATNHFTALFDIEPGLVSNRLLGESGNGTHENISAGYQNLPNDWIRIWAVGTTSGIEGPTLGMNPDAISYSLTSWTAVGTEEIYAWGLQYEDDKSSPTSYIPTENNPLGATRAADVASISGSNFSSWYRQDGGTVFVDVFNREVYSGTNLFPYVAQFDDGTNAQRISLDHSVLVGGYRTQYVVRDGDVNQASITAQSGLATGAAKWSAAYGLSSFASASNGAAAVAVGIGTKTIPTVNRLQIGIGAAAQYNGTLKRLTYWPQRLPNATLQNITT